MSNIEEAVRHILEIGVEQDYFDLKLKWTENNADLLHDILCLSNAECESSRYLIVGVGDDFSVAGLGEGQRKSHADLSDWWRRRSQSFAAHNSPKTRWHTIEYHAATLQIVEVLHDVARPYYLTEDYRKQDKVVRAFRVYTRDDSSNTPIDSSASPAQIENMYRERLGLLPRPLDRLNVLLNEVENWKTWADDLYYHSDVPEFTYRMEESTTGEHTLEWARGEIGHQLDSGNFTCEMRFFYHQTPLSGLSFVSFDGGKKKIVAPDWEPYGRGRLYFYEEGSLRHAAQRHIAARIGRDDSKGLRGAQGTFAIPVLSRAKVESFKKHFPFQNPPASDPDEQEHLFFDALKKIMSIEG